MGDEDSQKLQSLLTNRTSVLHEVTTTRFNQIDHIHLNLNEFNTYFATSFINYTSDHHLLSLRIPKHGNHFNAKFLEKLSFNVEKETRSKPMEPKGSFQRNAQRKEGTSKRRYKKNTTPVDLTCEDETDKNTESENQGSIDLTCLYSPNWLNDEVINTYLKLLNNHNNDVFMYKHNFMKHLLREGSKECKIITEDKMFYKKKKMSCLSMKFSFQFTMAVIGF